MQHIGQLLPESVGHVQLERARRDPDQLRVLPVAGRKARALGLGPAFRLWTCLQHIARVEYGSGRWPLESSFVDRVAEELGCSTRSVWRAIAAASGLMWFIDEKEGRRWIRLQGQARLSVELSARCEVAGIRDPHEPERRPCVLPRRLLGSEGLSAFWAGVFACWVAVHTNSSLTARYQDLEEWWGVSGRQLRTWCKLAGVRRIANIGQLDLGPSRADVEAVNQAARDHGDHSYTYNARGRAVRHWQRANTFAAHQGLQSSTAGRRRRINEAMQQRARVNRGRGAIPDRQSPPAHAGQPICNQTTSPSTPAGDGLSALQRRVAQIDARLRALYREQAGRTNYRDAGRARATQRKHPYLDLYILSETRVSAGYTRRVWDFSPALGV